MLAMSSSGEERLHMQALLTAMSPRVTEHQNTKLTITNTILTITRVTSVGGSHFVRAKSDCPETAWLTINIQVRQLTELDQ